MKSISNKYELKPGLIVVLKCGLRCKIDDNVSSLININEPDLSISLKEFEFNLKHRFTNDYDIIEIYYPNEELNWVKTSYGYWNSKTGDMYDENKHIFANDLVDRKLF